MRKEIKYLAFLLFPLLLLLSACRKEPFEPKDPTPPTEAGWTALHLRVNVSQGEETKATLDEHDIHYIFERDDLLYVVDTESYGVSSSSATYNANNPKLYGFLYLISGAGTTAAVFEGDLMYFDLDSHEPGEPDADFSITATLVSTSQREGSNPVFNCSNGKIAYAVSGGTIDVGPDYGDRVTASFKESVRKYSHFTAEATYGNPSFSLQQQSSFLLFNFSFDDDVVENTPMTVKIFNNTSTELLSTNVETLDHQAGFVAAFKSGTSLANAKVSVTDGVSFNKERSISSATLQANRYYHVTKTFIPLNYFTIQATQDDPSVTTTVTFNYTSGLEYRTKSGSTLGSWTPMTSSVPLTGSNAIQVRGTGNSSYNTNPIFTADKACQIYGDIMSLFCTDISVNPDIRSNSLASGALQGAFQGLTNIDISAGRPLFLSATSLAEGCYKQMFAGCTALTRMPSFYSEDGLSSASTFPASACEEMFANCTALAESSNLPATTAGASSYIRMFSGCTALVTAPDIKASTLDNNACQEMFSGCTSLLLCPSLAAATIPENGYRQMFEGCTALKNAPDILATTVNPYSCYQMFKGCTSLEMPPAELSAAATADHCYASMFEGCSKLGKTPMIDASGTLATSCFEGMFSECSMLRQATNSAFSFSVVGQNSCYQMFYKCGALNNAPDMPSVTSVGKYGCKEMYYQCSELSVAPTQLGASSATTISEEGYSGMFYQCLKIETAPEIYATQVDKNACLQMFYGCSRLKTPSVLPATSLSESCYQSMFQGCIGLTTLPATMLPATTLQELCYNQMFQGCTGLVELPENLLPAGNNNNGSLAFACYRKMFYGCTGITAVATNLLPATTLAPACYTNMFYGCTNLVAAPTLPATAPQPACYFGIFRECTKLTSAVCYMYLNNSQQGSSNPGNYDDTEDPPVETVGNIKGLRDWNVISKWTVFNKWMKNIKTTGTLSKDYRMTYPKAASANAHAGIPEGWTTSNYNSAP